MELAPVAGGAPGGAIPDPGGAPPRPDPAHHAPWPSLSAREARCGRADRASCGHRGGSTVAALTGAAYRRRALLEPDFNPSTARHTIALASQDLVGVFLLPALLRPFKAEAPGLSLEGVPRRASGLVARFEGGLLDLPVGVDFPEAPGLGRRLLWWDGWTASNWKLGWLPPHGLRAALFGWRTPGSASCSTFRGGSQIWCRQCPVLPVAGHG